MSSNKTGGKRLSAMDLLAKRESDSVVTAPAPAPERREVVRSVSGAALGNKRKRGPEKPFEGCAPRRIRNIPLVAKDRYDEIVRADLYRESFNQFILDAIEEKLKRGEQAAARKTAKAQDGGESV